MDEQGRSGGGGYSKYGIDEELEEDARPTLDVAQDKNIDTGAFPFEPYSLASLVSSTDNVGSLGTHCERGLSKNAARSADASHHAAFESEFEFTAPRRQRQCTVASWVGSARR